MSQKEAVIKGEKPGGYLIEARLIGSDAEPAMPEDDYY